MGLVVAMALAKSPPALGEGHRLVEKPIETEADPDEIAELVTEIARAVGAAADVEPGLSDETVRMIKAKILGICDDGQRAGPSPFKPPDGGTRAASFRARHASLAPPRSAHLQPGAPRRHIGGWREETRACRWTRRRSNG